MTIFFVKKHNMTVEAKNADEALAKAEKIVKGEKSGKKAKKTTDQ